MALMKLEVDDEDRDGIVFFSPQKTLHYALDSHHSPFQIWIFHIVQPGPILAARFPRLDLVLLSGHFTGGKLLTSKRVLYKVQQQIRVPLLI
ncbi:hypothetical protein V6N13_108827 [Hibiscus sabdariffa]